MKQSIIIATLLAGLLGLSACQEKSSPKTYKGHFHFTMASQTSIHQKVDTLLHKLTLNEKLDLLGGTGFTTKPISRLGIPALKMTDGPVGVRADEIKKGTHWPATAFPSGTSLAASWDTSLAYQEGAAIGVESRAEGQDVVLGPNVNIARNPKAGRTFEGFGEDPFLTSRMGVNYIKGMQSQGVAATVKHFAANTQEYHRLYINSKVKPRALHEIYFPTFKAAVQKAHIWAIMSAYNKLNGVFCSQNHYLLTHILRKKWGYKNLVMSDWGAVHATMPTETSGQDLEMPTGKFLNAKAIKPLLASGKVDTAQVNEQVRRILRVIVSLGLIKHPHQADSTLVDNASQRKLARKVAREGIVFLENHNHLLPLDLSGVDTIIVMGPAAKHVMRGGGSSLVSQPDEVTPWQALKQRIGQKVALKYVPGVIMNKHHAGPQPIQQAVKAAKSADLVLAFVGYNRHQVSEGHDIKSLRLPDGQDSLLKLVTKANPKTVVIVSAGEPVVMTPWNKQAGALVDNWFAGEETGNAIVDVLLGQYNPGGKLPLTFPKKWTDSPAAKYYKKSDSTAIHQEGIYVGYRYFDKHHIKPEYPFGYGLSYTTFSFSNIKAAKKDSSVEVTFTVKNTGQKAGHEVAQVYIHKNNSNVKRAPHALKGFSRVQLSPGQSKKVTITIPREQFAYFNMQQKKWMVEPGNYTILAGSSSRKLPLKATVSW